MALVRASKQAVDGGAPGCSESVGGEWTRASHERTVRVGESPPLSPSYQQQQQLKMLRILPRISASSRAFSTSARRLETPLTTAGPVTPPPKAELNPTVKSRPARGVDPKIVVAGAPVDPIVESVPVKKVVVESAPLPPPPAPEPTPAPAPTGRAKRPVGAFRGG